MRKTVREFAQLFLRSFSTVIVTFIWGDIWNLRMSIRKSKAFFSVKDILYQAVFMKDGGGWIGLGAELAEVPTFPHGFSGVFISNSARIGKRCVIFQGVVIGSNGLKESRGFGAPVIGDDVFIGAGAKIIGNVKIGNGVRIGANCVVVKDVPPNSVVVLSSPRVIVRDGKMDNSFVANPYNPKIA